MIVSATVGAYVVSNKQVDVEPSFYVWCNPDNGNCIRITPSEIKIHFNK